MALVGAWHPASMEGNHYCSNPQEEGRGVLLVRVRRLQVLHVFLVAALGFYLTLGRGVMIETKYTWVFPAQFLKRWNVRLGRRRPSRWEEVTEQQSQIKNARYRKKPACQGTAVLGSQVRFTVILQAFPCARSCSAISSQSWRCECSKAVVQETQHSSLRLLPAVSGEDMASSSCQRDP